MNQIYSVKYVDETYKISSKEDPILINTESGEINGSELRPTFKKLCSILNLIGDNMYVVSNTIRCEKIVDMKLHRYVITIEERHEMPPRYMSYLVKYLFNKSK